MDAVGKELSEIKELLETIGRSGDAFFKKTLARICLIGVYIKRRANLELISADAIISEWSRFITEMSKNSANMPFANNETDLFYLIDRAKVMGLDVIITGTIPEDESFMSILKDALKCQMTNVIKHAGGKKLFVSISAQDGSHILSLTNDGSAN